MSKVETIREVWAKPLIMQLKLSETAEEKGTAFLDAECVGSTDEPGLCS